MVELHRNRCVAIAAIEAWSVSQPKKEVSYRKRATPPRGTPPSLRTRRTLSLSALMPKARRSNCVAVGAHDVALSDLRQQPLARHQHGAGTGHLKGLLRGIAMVEVHLVRLEAAATVRARDATQLTQELEGRGLARTDALDLLRAVPCVVGDVERPLATSCCHAAIKNRCAWGVNRTLRVRPRTLSEFSEGAP